MESEVNIADILKNKPQGTKLYSPAFGECTLYLAECLNVLDKDKIKHSFMGSGKLQRFGEIMLFPSNIMRDWSKFAWPDKCTSREQAMEDDWIEVDNKHYCPDCYEFDRELEDYVPKKKGD